MVNEYFVAVYLDEQCQNETMRFRQFGTDSIVKKVEAQCSNWEVIVLTPLWDETMPQGNYWTRKEIYVN